jgi:hypothetical protein
MLVNELVSLAFIFNFEGEGVIQSEKKVINFLVGHQSFNLSPYVPKARK